VKAKTSTLAIAGKPKAHPIKPSNQAIALPDGWALHSPFGFMGIDATPAGRLVRLADVLHWLEKSRSLPRVAALAVLCEAMPREVVSWLYWVRPSDYAKPVPVDWMWGYMTAAQIEAKRQADEWAGMRSVMARERKFDRWGESPSRWHIEGGKISFATPQPTEPGKPALLKILRKWWVHPKYKKLSTCDILDDPAMTNLVNLAIQLDKAAALWGYGEILKAVDSEPSTFVELVALRKAKPRLQWTDTARKIVKAEVDHRFNQPGHRKAIAEALDLSPTRIGQLIDPNRQPKRKPAANLRSVNG
jgi:hypothetical protein